MLGVEQQCAGGNLLVVLSAWRLGVVVLTLADKE